MKLNAKQREFVEEFSQLDPAMPRAMGLILGYLLVCEPAEQTSLAMQAELGLSAGSISGMIGMLVDSGLVARVKRSGDRKWYYLIAKDSWQHTIQRRLRSIENFRNAAVKGMAVADNYRMHEFYTVFGFFADELERAANRLAEMRHDATRNR